MRLGKIEKRGSHQGADRRDIARDHENLGAMPAGLIEEV